MWNITKTTDKQTKKVPLCIVVDWSTRFRQPRTNGDISMGQSILCPNADKVDRSTDGLIDNSDSLIELNITNEMKVMDTTSENTKGKTATHKQSRENTVISNGGMTANSHEQMIPS